MRCQDCNKFVSVEVTTQDTSAEAAIIETTENDSAFIESQIEVELCCAECGSTVMHHEFSIDDEVALTRAITEAEAEEEGLVCTIEDIEPITVTEKRKTRYGFSCSIVISLTVGGSTEEIARQEFSDTEPMSEFEESC